MTMCRGVVILIGMCIVYTLSAVRHGPKPGSQEAEAKGAFIIYGYQGGGGILGFRCTEILPPLRIGALKIQGSKLQKILLIRRITLQNIYLSPGISTCPAGKVQKRYMSFYLPTLP